MKKCTKCEQEKEEKDFYKSRSGKNGLMSECKKCADYRKTIRIREKSKREGKKPKYYSLDVREDLKNGVKYCYGCNTKKQFSEFCKYKNGTGGLDCLCRECKKKNYKLFKLSKEELHEKYIRNKIRLKNGKLLRSFNITLDEYNSLLEKQEYKCAICGKTDIENGKMLAVDHCHKTNKNRELLCNNCNVAIGFLHDNI